MDQAGYAGAPLQETAVARAMLEVIEAQTDMSPVYALDEAEVRIGRSPNQSQLAFVNDITVSRFHAVLRLEGARYRIYDMGSTSGTRVNDRPVPEYGLQLNDGDDIQLGAVRLRYRQL
jgi:pSer/pThr/pTyr-binding forkhead associated (FHA) protein